MTTFNAQQIEVFVEAIQSIISQLEALNLKPFNERVMNLKKNINSFHDHTIRSGLVGITSSGKSSLLNTLLGTGKQILKEQSKATTNMIVFCSKAETPQLEIHYQGKDTVKKSGATVLSKSIWKYTSEDENPENKFHVKFIRLAIPSFILDHNIEVADTPGLDAYGLQEHEDLTLREFLPQADLIIYLSSVRSPMKDKDREILNRIMDTEQQVIFVQTCKGAVVEENLGDGTTLSTAELLDKYKNEFKQAISPYKQLAGSPIVQVETKLAMKKFNNDDESAWEESGVAELVTLVNDISRQLKERYTLRSVLKSIDELVTLSRLINNSIIQDKEKEKGLSEISDFIKKYKYYHNKIVSEKNKVIAKCRDLLDPIKVYREIKKELLEAESEDDFYIVSDTVGDRVRRLKNTFLDLLDNSKKDYKHYLNKMGFNIKRTDLQEVTKSAFFFPNVEKKMRIKKEVQISNQSRTKKELYLDKEKYYGELKESLKYYVAPLLQHLEWWENNISFSYVNPLQKKITAFKKDMANVKKGFQFEQHEHDGLVTIVNEMDILIEDASQIHNKDPFKEKIVYAEYKKKLFSTYKREATHQNLFLQLSNLLFENLFHTEYMRKVSTMSGKNDFFVALIGQDYASQVSFLRRLCRFTDDSLIRLQNLTPPYTLNRFKAIPNVKNLNLPGELYDQLSFIILGDDEASFTVSNDAEVFRQADVVQFMIDDLHRVSSAITDIKKRSVFFNMIKEHTAKLLLTYSKAAYFQKDRLHLLVKEAVNEINALFHPQNVQWFIYENFEVRYNHYHDIASKMKNEKYKVKECIQEWRKLELPFDEPFTEKILSEQFEEIIQG